MLTVEQIYSKTNRPDPLQEQASTLTASNRLKETGGNSLQRGRAFFEFIGRRELLLSADTPVQKRFLLAIPTRGIGP